MTVKAWQVLVIGAVLVLASVLISYATPSRKPLPEEVCASLKSVFPDFLYVGSFSLKDGIPAPHSHTVVTLPLNLQQHQAYVFHRQRSASPIDYGEFVARLKNAKARILWAPSGPQELVHLTFGGPLFKIEFAAGPHKGSLYNTIDSNIAADESLSKDLFIEDFVLVLER
ncbi:MAG: hypothetical protein JNL98_32320 [Bryobacterales bacterium]|nr:hypothetical protein [Bryobacterales bacterium]